MEDAIAEASDPNNANNGPAKTQKVKKIVGILLVKQVCYMAVARAYAKLLTMPLPSSASCLIPKVKPVFFSAAKPQLIAL